MTKVPFIVDRQDPGNAQSFQDLDAFQNQDGLVVTGARPDPGDPNRLVISLAPSAATRAFAGAPLTAAAGPGPGDIPAAGGGGSPLKILCVHGVNHLESDPQGPTTESERVWRRAIAAGLARWNARADVQFVAYNQHFAEADLGPVELATAVARLGASGIWHGIGDLFGAEGARGFGPQQGLGDTIEWTAGMVAEWAGNDALRASLRKTLLAAIERHRPQLILAHSLGTLIAYDTLARPNHARKPGVSGATLVTFGSQVGHPFVRRVLGGRIVPIPALRHWFHLYNPNDRVFTAPLDVRFQQADIPNFSQHNTEFDIEWDPLNHDADRYLLHPDTSLSVWRHAATLAGAIPRLLPGMPRMTSLATDAEKRARSAGGVAGASPVSAYLRRSTREKRALLVGLSQYPNPANNLPGCSNDVFLMSRVLQEAKFDAANIRMLLDHRATASAILERLEWLLDGAGDGQDRVFYYAGHGAQIPGYGSGETIDGLDECLVPYDFAWNRETAVLDDQFHELYSQLPLKTRFLTIFDCCHSGGLARDGGLVARGLTPPDDIRHRMLKWNPSANVFVSRDADGVTASKKAGKTPPDSRHGALRKLGCGVRLRSKSKVRYNRARADFGHSGPFMPVILQACSESQLAFEYRHGSISNGAFTYFLSKTLEDPKFRGRLDWAGLVKEVGIRLKHQGYVQTPQLVCPTALSHDKVPWK